MSDKKKQQLGMNPSTASNRLVKDLLWDFVSKTNNKCFHCGCEMSRETFSVEHKEPWLDSDDPVGLYFGLDNISYSHLSCNVSAARREKTDPEVKKARQKMRDANRPYDPEKRRERYLRLGS